MALDQLEMNDRPDPSSAPETGLWHPVLSADALSAGEPAAVRLLSQDLVLWRDAEGRPRVLGDRCPHRGTRLSIGRVVDGHVECPYHGWQFEGGGRCVHVPAAPDFVPPAGHAATAYEAVEARGLVWVRLTPGGGELPAFDAEDEPRLRKLLCGPYTVASSAPRIVENFLDMAHFGFVHEGWLGDPGHTALADYTIEPIAGGFAATGCRAWQPKSNRLSDGGSWVDYRYELNAPYSALLVKLPQAQDGYRDVIALYICPVDPERSTVWFRMAVTDFASSDEELRAFQHTIFTQDQPILESQQPRRLPLAAGAEVHHAADRASAAYRRLLREQHITFGTC
jgi:phenylpropionate dioxygenase-like ring-hydroxylating dioxygenase large terminal subunit